MYKLFRTLLLPVAALFALTAATAQNVSWKSSVEHLEGDVYRIVLEASIPAPYHMYDMGPYEGGPNATAIVFTPGDGVTLEGGVEQLSTPERHYDKTFEMEIGTFAGKARFAQQVKLAAAKASVKAAIEWMICDEVSCMPPDDTELTVELTARPGSASANSTEAVTPNKNVSAGDTPAKDTPADTASGTAPTAAAEIVPAQKDAAGGGTLWALIIEAILWGFAALLTPCVFPMVPMTVSFFMKGEGGPARGRFRAAMYGFFIVALYTLPIAAIIVITRILGGDTVTADIFNWLATHWLPNILFFLVFMVFAASFFGAFEITMPSWMVNKTDAKADSKGLAGIFFMALTLVLVSFSCTGPIVGSVLIKSTSGEFWSPIVTMLAFSVAFALPFTIFAFFPSMLKKLPKSGGWLNSVKVVLGFIEVALGMKFLSVADQTYHWGLLDREIYLAVWIVTFSLLGLYLLGKIKFAARQRHALPRRRTAGAGDHHLLVRRIPDSRHVGCAPQGTFGLPAAPAYAGLRHRTGRLSRSVGRTGHAADRRRRKTQAQRLPAPAARTRRILRPAGGRSIRRESRQAAVHRLHGPRLRTTAAKWKPAFGPIRRCWISCAGIT